MSAKKKVQARKPVKKKATAKSTPKARGKSASQSVKDRRKPKDRRSNTVARSSGRRRNDTARIKEPQLRVEVLEKSFAALAPHGDELVNRFYAELFRRHPGVKPLFAHVNLASQKRKLLAALVLVVRSLRNPAALSKALFQMIPEHVGAIALGLSRGKTFVA